MSTSILSPTSGWRDTLAGVLFVALLAMAVTQLAALPALRQAGLSPLVLGIVAGMLYGNFLRGNETPGWKVGVHFTAKRLLRIAVAFYGLNISIQQIIAIGAPAIAVSVAVVVGVLALGTLVGTRVLGLDRDTAILTSAGSAICGAAAVLAFEPTLKSAPHKSAVAVASVVLFGTLSLFLYPILYRSGALGLDAHGWGIYIGATVHEVAQVVGAASAIDPATTQAATIVKMTRVALLAPILIILGIYLRQAAGATDGKRAPVVIPWFAIGFLALALVNSSGIIPADLLTTLRHLDIFALTMAMTALGMETRFGQIRQAGAKVIGLAFFLFILLSVGGYGLVRFIVN
ncbi:YeiH family protein [Alcaligenes phenolicus]|uniref:YeiH family protein n=1 Tax=Alcaligenes phenolicus TaxID=232846 RepID=A0AAW5W059_9BURK|nr:YeiH family protein [Alcaligenes phenolicus]MCX5565674.1 YeiH family protein [Alcaligenes phenolicus]